MIKASKMAKVVITFLVIMGLFCKYTELYLAWKTVSLLLIGIMFADGSFRNGFRKSLRSIYFILLLLFAVLSSIFSPSATYIIGNFLYILWPLLYITTMCGLLYSHGDAVEKILNKLFVPLNFIYILNLVLIAIQCSGHPILIKGSWLAYNSFYEDLCCGLFGLNGTHEFTSFALFMNIFILCYAQNKRNSTRKGLYFYIVVLDLFLLFLSTENDNVAMFVLMPLFIVLFFTVRIHFKTERIKKTIKKLIKLAIPICLIFLVVINIPYIKRYMDEYVWIRINMLVNFNRSYFQVAGSNERFAIVFSALSEPFGWLLGRGFGTADFGGGIFFGFDSFGLSSIGSFIMIGGIWFYLMYTLQVCREIQYLVKKKFKIDTFGLLIFLLTVSYTSYTILYTSFVSTLWYGFIFAEIGFLKRKMDKDRHLNLNMEAFQT